MAEHVDLGQATARQARDGAVVALEGFTEPIPLVARHEDHRARPRGSGVDSRGCSPRSHGRTSQGGDPVAVAGFSRPRGDRTAHRVRTRGSARPQSEGHDRMSVARCDILVIGGSVTGCGAAPTSGRGLLGRWLRLKQPRATTDQRSPETEESWSRTACQHSLPVPDSPR